MRKANELCKELRAKSGMSTRKLANELGVQQSTICNIESGHTSVTKDMAERYAVVFGEEYLDPLTEEIVRFFVDPVALNNVMKEKGIKTTTAAKAFGVKEGSFSILTNPKEGYRKLLTHSEVENLAFYFGVPISKLNPEKTLLLKRPASHKELQLQKREEAPVAVNKFSYTVDKSGCVKATAVSTSDELKAQLKKYSEYCDAKDKENAELKAKLAEMDILEAKYKESQDHVESLTKQTDDAIKEMLRVNDVCGKLRDRVNELEKLNKTLNADYSSLYSEHDETLTRLDNLTELYNDLKASKPQVVEVIPEDYNQVLETNKRYKDVLFDLLLKRYEEETK